MCISTLDVYLPKTLIAEEPRRQTTGFAGEVGTTQLTSQLLWKGLNMADADLISFLSRAFINALKLLFPPTLNGAMHVKAPGGNQVSGCPLCGTKRYETLYRSFIRTMCDNILHSTMAHDVQPTCKNHVRSLVKLFLSFTGCVAFLNDDRKKLAFWINSSPSGLFLAQQTPMLMLITNDYDFEDGGVVEITPQYYHPFLTAQNLSTRVVYSLASQASWLSCCGPTWMGVAAWSDTLPRACGRNDPEKDIRILSVYFKATAYEVVDSKCPVLKRVVCAKVTFRIARRRHTPPSKSTAIPSVDHSFTGINQNVNDNGQGKDCGPHQVNWLGPHSTITSDFGNERPLNHHLNQQGPLPKEEGLGKGIHDFGAGTLPGTFYDPVGEEAVCDGFLRNRTNLTTPKRGAMADTAIARKRKWSSETTQPLVTKMSDTAPDVQRRCIASAVDGLMILDNAKQGRTTLARYDLDIKPIQPLQIRRNNVKAHTVPNKEPCERIRDFSGSHSHGSRTDDPGMISWSSGSESGVTAPSDTQTNLKLGQFAEPVEKKASSTHCNSDTASAVNTDDFVDWHLRTKMQEAEASREREMLLYAQEASIVQSTPLHHCQTKKSQDPKRATRAMSTNNPFRRNTAAQLSGAMEFRNGPMATVPASKLDEPACVFDELLDALEAKAADAMSARTFSTVSMSTAADTQGLSRTSTDAAGVCRANDDISEKQECSWTAMNSLRDEGISFICQPTTKTIAQILRGDFFPKSWAQVAREGAINAAKANLLGNKEGSAHSAGDTIPLPHLSNGRPKSSFVAVDAACPEPTPTTAGPPGLPDPYRPRGMPATPYLIPRRLAHNMLQPKPGHRLNSWNLHHFGANARKASDEVTQGLASGTGESIADNESSAADENATALWGERGVAGGTRAVSECAGEYDELGSESESLLGSAASSFGDRWWLDYRGAEA